MIPALGLGAWLASIAGTLTARVLLALGFSVVSVTGVTVTMDALRDLFISNLQAAPAMGLQLATLSGVGVAFGLILGAVAFRLLLWQVANAVRILSSSAGS